MRARLWAIVGGAVRDPGPDRVPHPLRQLGSIERHLASARSAHALGVEGVLRAVELDDEPARRWITGLNAIVRRQLGAGHADEAPVRGVAGDDAAEPARARGPAVASAAHRF